MGLFDFAESGLRASLCHVNSHYLLSDLIFRGAVLGALVSAVTFNISSSLVAGSSFTPALTSAFSKDVLVRCGSAAASAAFESPYLYVHRSFPLQVSFFLSVLFSFLSQECNCWSRG